MQSSRLSLSRLAARLDAAIFFAVNKPASWPGGIVATAITAGNTVSRGANNAAAGGIAQDVADVFTTVETDGYDVNGIAANVAYRGRLRGARNASGDQHSEVTTTSAYGIDISYPMRGLWPTGVGAAELVAGDFTQGILGVRQDITYKILDQAVITDGSGVIQYNLAQQDMVAMRVVARFGFAVPNTINYDNSNAATRYPFGVLRAP